MSINEDNQLAPRGPRIAIVHDWLPLIGGAERVLEQLLKLYPDADLFTLFNFLDDNDARFLADRKITTSFVQNAPFARKHYRNYLPLMPMAVENFNLAGYDLIVSSSSAVAKSVLTGPDQLHVCYCHSPMRYAWDLQEEYLAQTGIGSGLKSTIVRYLLHRIRIWDAIAANRVDAFIANSGYIQRRIRKTYRRESTVIHPPVDVDRFQIKTEKENFYLAASRQVPYKRIDLIVQAFREMPDKRLIVIGDGPEHAKIRALATTPNIEILGYQNDAVMVDYMRRAKAFVFAAQEDFGILPVEAQACGTPVIAFGRGGACETVLDKYTGLLFAHQTTESLTDAVARFERLQKNFDPAQIRKHATSFSAERFRSEISKFVEEQRQAAATDEPKPRSTQSPRVARITRRPG